MKRRLMIAVLALAGAGSVFAQKDPGKDTIGVVTVTVYYGTNGDPAAAGSRARPVSSAVSERMASEEKLKFTTYRELGSEAKPLFRTYENWAKPLAPSDEVLLRFEAQSKLSKEVMRLDVELWLSRKKILKTDAPMQPDKPLLVLGPEWRGGRLIISVALQPGRPEKP